MADIKRKNALRYGNFCNEEGIEALVTNCLGSRDADVRILARQSLISCGRLAIDRLILELENPEIAGEVYHILLGINDDSVRPYLMEQYRKGNEFSFRAAYALYFWDDNWSESRFELISEGLNSDHFRIRAYATRALRNFEEKDVIPMLLKMVDDEDWRVRSEAIVTLARIDDKFVTAHILPIMNNVEIDYGKRVYSKVIHSLERLGNEEAMNGLITLLRSKSGYARSKSQDRIMQLDYASAGEQLTDDFNKKPEQTRLAIVQIIGHWGCKESIHFLQQAFYDSSESVASLAADELKKLGINVNPF